jgi:hypothetical protein
VRPSRDVTPERETLMITINAKIVEMNITPANP